MLKPIIRHGDREREGKGFSLKELKEAKITIQQAKKLKIAVDKRRKTILDENINILKNFIKDNQGH